MKSLPAYSSFIASSDTRPSDLRRDTQTIELRIYRAGLCNVYTDGRDKPTMYWFVHATYVLLKPGVHIIAGMATIARKISAIRTIVWKPCAQRS